MKKFLKTISILLVLFMLTAITACKTEDTDLQKQLDEKQAEIDAMKAEMDEKENLTEDQIKEYQDKITQLEADKQSLEDKQKEEEPEEVVEENPYKEKINIYMTNGFNTAYDDLNSRWDVLLVEEKFNVDLQCESIHKDNFKAMVAADNYPDFYSRYNPSGFVWTYYGDGNDIFRTVTKDQLKEYMPNYCQIRDDMDPSSWNFNIHKDADGNKEEGVYCGIDGFDPISRLSGFITTVYRYDWLINLGVDIPDAIQVDEDGRYFIADYQFSYEEFNQLVEKMVKGDPDGDGENNTYAFQMPNENRAIDDGYYWTPIYGMFGFSMIYPSQSGVIKDSKTGKYTLTITSPQYIEATAYMNDLIQKDYLGVYKDNAGRGLITGNIGMGFYTPAWANHPGLIEPLLEANPEAKIIILPPPAGPNGDSAATAYVGGVWSTTTRAVMVSKYVEDDKLFRMMQILDYVWTDPEDRYQFMFGKEGENFRWIDKDMNWLQKFTSDEIKDEYLSLQSGWFNIGNFKHELTVTNKVQAKWYSYIKEWEWVDKYLKKPDKIADDAFYSTAEFANAFDKALDEEIDFKAIYTTVRNIYNSIMKKEIIDVETEFNTKMADMNALGYDKYIEFMNDPDWRMVE